MSVAGTGYQQHLVPAKYEDAARLVGGTVHQETGYHDHQ